MYVEPPEKTPTPGFVASVAVQIPIRSNNPREKPPLVVTVVVVLLVDVDPNLSLSFSYTLTCLFSISLSTPRNRRILVAMTKFIGESFAEICATHVSIMFRHSGY